MTMNEDNALHLGCLFKLSGIVAQVIALLLLGEIAVFSVLPSIGAPAQLLSDFQENWFFGLLRFDLLGMISYVLFIPVILSFYFTLRRSNESFTLVSTVLFFMGISIFFSTNTGFSVLSLSAQYGAAKSAAEKTLIEAACQSMITLFKVNAFMLSYVVVSASWVMISIAMLKSGNFSKLTSWAGIVAGASGIVAEVAEHASESFRWIAIALYFAAIVFLLFWIITAGLRLYGIGVALIKQDELSF
jgi:Domain of unknown function (DUF4386)